MDDHTVAISAGDSGSNAASRLESSADAMIEDEPASTVSSRETTMSPRPESATTSATTPAPSAGGAGEASKKSDAGEDGFASASRLQSRPRASDVVQTQERRAAGLMPRHDVGNGQEAGPVDVVEEDLMAPSMGSDYPSLRVSVALVVDI